MAANLPFVPTVCSGFMPFFKLVDSLSWGSGPPITASVIHPTSLCAGCALLFKIHCELVTLTRNHLCGINLRGGGINLRGHKSETNARLHSFLVLSGLQSHVSEPMHASQDSQFIKEWLRSLWKVSRPSKWKEKRLFKGHYSEYNKTCFSDQRLLNNMCHEEIIKIVKLTSKIGIWLAAKHSAYGEGMLRYSSVSAR